MSTRRLSYSEISMCLTCEAQWSFSYGGQLTNGTTLHKRALHPNLTNGSAWGAMVAAWHAYKAPLDLFYEYQAAQARFKAYKAMSESLWKDVDKQAENGVLISLETLVETEEWLGEIFDHYASNVERTPLIKLEDEIDVAIPSRGGKRGSNKYRFQGFLDGVEIKNGQAWIREYKLRDNLTKAKIIELSRQIRWYAWAKAEKKGNQFTWKGHPIVGVIVEERLAAAPKPPKLVNAKRKSDGIDGKVPSSDVRQMCLPEDYVALCEEYGVEPSEEAKAAYKSRIWQKEFPIVFRPGELEEAGQELVSAAKLIRDLDSGERFPIRNAQARLCNSCRFLDICANPTDDMFIDSLFIRKAPKKDRTPDEEVQPTSTNPFQAAVTEVREHERAELDKPATNPSYVIA